MNHVYTLLLAVASLVCYGQSAPINNSSLKFYEHLYAKGALLKKSDIGHVSTAAYAIAYATDSVHPVQYFERAAELLQSSMLNDAAFLYYMGKLRHSYLERNKPNSNERQTDAMKAYTYRVGEPLRLYLQTNLENYIGILQKVHKFYDENDSVFFPGGHYPEIYQDIAQKFGEEIIELQTNKKKYSRQFAKERKAMKKLIRGV